jgi:hypothetical protein
LSQSSPSSVPPAPSRRCRATTARGHPCRAWAVKGARYCAVHSRRHPLNSLPQDPGLDPPRPPLATLDDLIADMFEKMACFSAMIDQAEDIHIYMKMFAVYSRNATHLARLLREKRLCPGNSTDDFMTFLGQAIDEAGKELGIDLSHL